MAPQVVVPERIACAAQRAAFVGDVEGGAWLLGRVVSIGADPWSGEACRRYIVREVIPLTSGDVSSAGATHLTVRTETFVRLLKRAGEDGDVPGFLHGHPGGQDGFSSWDDRNEAVLWSAARNRNGDAAELLSVLALPGGAFRARIWSNESAPALSDVWLTGGACRLDRPCVEAPARPDLDRQARVFGDRFNATLSQLRVVVVGAGGTGSPLAMMLARAGVGQLAVIDDDLVEATNLHRLHGVGRRDVGRPKAEAICDHLSGLGLEGAFVPVVANVLDARCRDALRAANVIFCATDDHAGRLMLNRFAYFYETPVIDLGLAVGPQILGKLRDMTGRVTLLYPGAPCLLCRGIVDPVKARDEELRRSAPEEYARRREEGYVFGGGDPEPAFIAQTTSVAAMAMNEFTQLLCEFRGGRRITQRLRRFQVPEDRVSGACSRADCAVCGDAFYWGIGDVEPFLDRVG